MVRTPSYDKRGLKKGTWTPEEDKKLVDYVTRYGCWNWSQLPRFAGLARCGKSCRLRWMNYLRPDVKRGNYTKAEEEIIIRLHAELGNRWSIIAAHLPGRTDNEIKNYWHTNLKKRFQQNGVTREKAIASTSEDNEFRQERDHGVFQGTTPPAATSQISDTGPLSPISSSSEFSSITTDQTKATTASDKNLALEDDFSFLDAFVDGDFWTEPYLAEISHTPNEIVPDHRNCSFQSPDSTQIPDAGVLSPQPSSCGSLVLGNDFAFLDEYTQPTIENFWTEPYVADMSPGPSELLTPSLTDQSEYFSLVYDVDLDLWSRSNLYDEHISLYQ